MKCALITGITGQSGSYLAELLLGKGYKVFGLVRRSSNEHHLYRIEHILDRLQLRDGDVSDFFSISNTLNEILREPSDVIEIYNLAAQSDVGISFLGPSEVLQTNLGGILNILNAVKMAGTSHKNIRIYQASTSEQFGKVLAIPQNEKTPFNPCSPYAVSKTAGHQMVQVYRNSYNLFACCGILFNHESPRRGCHFVTRKVTKHIARLMEQIARGSSEFDVLNLGNLNSERDWGFAPDYVEAMWLMLQQSKPQDFVIATGKKHTVRDFVTKCFRHYDIEIKWEGEGIHEVGKFGNQVFVSVDKQLFRPCEVDLLLGDSSLAKEVLGWYPKTSVDDIISTMLHHDEFLLLKKE